MSAAPAGRWRRRAFLITIGLGWVGYGTGIVSDPRYGTARGLGHIVRHVTLDTLGWGWVACGLLAVLAGAVAGCPRIEALGFVALATPAALWGAAFTITWAGGGFPSAWSSACAWVAFALGILWVSGMDETPAEHLRKKV
ncbi:hypothetical protein [Streptomyces sp. NPDC006638]|uniref:hypothetical protein n=1 Tax=Streptomyces sp. NPDC006638 TaxID=3157183 RepID=UPI0033B1298D